MILPHLFFANNPLISAFVHADFFGKLIFIGLALLSILSWTFLISKFLLLRHHINITGSELRNYQFNKKPPLSFADHSKKEGSLQYLYSIFCDSSLALLHKNRRYKGENSDDIVTLSASDVEQISTQLEEGLLHLLRPLENRLYILPTVVTLAPFLGLLGTVWGIMATLGELSNHSGTNPAMLGGLALALTTTVVGLLVAIPPLIGYPLIQAKIRQLRNDWEGFNIRALHALEIHYRRVEE